MDKKMIRLNINILKTLMVMFFLVIPGTSCKYVNYDKHNTFLFVMRVFDKGTGSPINDFKVYFVDKGLDEMRSKRGERILVNFMKSGESYIGSIDCWYGWKSIFLNTRNQQSCTFDIIVESNGYKDGVIPIKYDKFLKNRETVEFDIKVHLKN